MKGATMLFLQFNTISPHDLRFRKRHFLVLAFQIATFVPLTWLVATMPDGASEYSPNAPCSALSALRRSARGCSLCSSCRCFWRGSYAKP